MDDIFENSPQNENLGLKTVDLFGKFVVCLETESKKNEITYSSWILLSCRLGSK